MIRCGLGAALLLQLVGQDDGFGQVAHGAAQTAAFVAQLQVGIFFGDAQLVLHDALGTFHHLAGFERALGFQRFRHEAGVFNGNGGLAGDHLDEIDFVFGELVRFAGIDIDGADHGVAREHGDGEQRGETGLARQFRVAVLLLFEHVGNHDGLAFANHAADQRILDLERHAVEVILRGAARRADHQFLAFFIHQHDGADRRIELVGDHFRDGLQNAVEVVRFVELAGESDERFHAAGGALGTFGELALGDGAAHLFAQEGDQRDFILRCGDAPFCGEC